MTVQELLNSIGETHNIRGILESLYKSRNNNSHGEDIAQEIDLYMKNRDFLALYVYTYALMDAQT